MTDLRKAAEMALEFIVLSSSKDRAWFTEKEFEVVAALRQALAQPEQRPVGTYEGVMETMLSLRKGTLEQQQIYTHMKDKLLYTAPPKREWVGLTDEEIKQIELSLRQYNSRDTYDLSLKDFAKAIEAKLKEKNGG